jgi:hypothetical protein
MTMPSEEHYATLIEGLRNAKAVLSEPTETDEPVHWRRFEAGLRGLRVVMKYLQTDTEVFDGSLTQPLSVIESTVHHILVVEMESAALAKMESAVVAEMGQRPATEAPAPLDCRIPRARPMISSRKM